MDVTACSRWTELLISLWWDRVLWNKETLLDSSQNLSFRSRSLTGKQAEGSQQGSVEFYSKILNEIQSVLDCYKGQKMFENFYFPQVQKMWTVLHASDMINS